MPICLGNFIKKTNSILSVEPDTMAWNKHSEKEKKLIGNNLFLLYYGNKVHLHSAALVMQSVKYLSYLKKSRIRETLLKWYGKWNWGSWGSALNWKSVHNYIYTHNYLFQSALKIINQLSFLLEWDFSFVFRHWKTPSGKTLRYLMKHRFIESLFLNILLYWACMWLSTPELNQSTIWIK